MALTTEEKRAELHAAIENMPGGVVDLLMPALVEVVNSKKDVNNIFLARAIRALLTLMEEVPVEEATAAPSDYDLFLTLLQRSEVIQALPSRDPLAEARIRGLLAKRQLLEAEGGCMSSEEVATVLGIKRQAVDKRRINGKLIGLSSGRVYLYPAWQFVDGKTLPGLEQVLKRLGVQDPWMQTAWMLNGNSRLEGRKPLVVLREGFLEAVLEAAEVYGEQGAA